jgi:hypothetical protein
MDQGLCAGLTLKDGRSLFERMVRGTWEYLEGYYPVL